MTAKKKFPQFSHLTAPELKRLLRKSTLSDEDKKIADGVLGHDRDYIDVGVEIPMDRTTVSRHMRQIIAPELERLMKITEHRQSPGP